MLKYYFKLASLRIASSIPFPNSFACRRIVIVIWRQWHSLLLPNEYYRIKLYKSMYILCNFTQHTFIFSILYIFTVFIHIPKKIPKISIFEISFSYALNSAFTLLAKLSKILLYASVISSSFNV